MYDEILEQASKWNASFKEYKKGFYHDGNLLNFIKKTAYDINAPHEDDHLRTPMTEVLIEELIAMGDQFVINKAMVQNIHHALFSGELESTGVAPGMWRCHNVKVGDHFPPDHIHLEYLMNHFFSQVNKMTPTSMYKVFQTIHPFSDGNGRVGGILLAVRSYLDSNGEIMISPCQ